MYTRDYVMRLIERFGRALIALRNRILGRELVEASARGELRQIAAQAGLDLDVARGLDPAMLLMWLAPTGEPDPPRFWLMAELLYLEALVARGEGHEDDARADFARARALFARLPPEWRPADELASAGERLREIADTVDRQG